jgi:hypothetical protein
LFVVARSRRCRAALKECSAMLQTACPSVDVLQGLYLGGLDESEAENLEQHVQSCPACLQQLKALLGTNDSLVADLRTGTDTEDLATFPVLSELMKKLVRLPRGGTPTPPCVTDAPTVPPGDAQLPQAIPLSIALPSAEAPIALDPDTHANLTDFLAPPQSADELGRLGRYRILAILGHGGMGVVYKAEDSKLKRAVALKAMLPTLAASASAGKRFLREAEAMAAVEHDHIVRIYNVDEDHGVPFLAMEFLKGEPLDQRLKREAALPLAEVLRIGREVAEGLSAAHATGLIHRDIKPGNIWLEAPRNRVKILDFGLARAASQDAGLTQQGAIVGTPAYMAPEQARGAAVDARCDLFSLGVVLYRLTTGRQPFTGADNVATLMAVALEDPPAPVMVNPALPMELSDLVMKLLEKDPVKRVTSADEVVRTLQALEKKLPRQEAAKVQTPAPRAVAKPPAKTPCVAAPKRGRLPLVFGAVAAVVLLAGGGIATVIYLKAPPGTGNQPPGAFVIDTDDPDFIFNVNKDGGVTLKDKKMDREYNLKVVRHDEKSGEYELEVTDVKGDLNFKTDRFTIKRGDTVVASLWFERPPSFPPPPPDPNLPDRVTDEWIKQIAGLPADKQVEQVSAMLQKLNAGFDGKLTPGYEGDAVKGLDIVADKVTDLSPLRALTELQKFSYSGSGAGKAKLADLSPLTELKLTELSVKHAQMSNLSPLKDMPLTKLTCAHTEVKSLDQLKDLKLLTSLDCESTGVSDLAPLTDLKKLIALSIRNTKVGDLSALKDLPLKELDCRGIPVKDLTQLKNLSLLERLECDYKPERDKGVLLAIKSLKSVNGVPPALLPPTDELSPGENHDMYVEDVAKQDLDKQQARVTARLKGVNDPRYPPSASFKIEGGVIVGVTVSSGAPKTAAAKDTLNLWPLQALKQLKTLQVAGPSLFDLRPLRGINLTELRCVDTQVVDVAPLADMPLTALYLDSTPVSNLSPLNKRLEALHLQHTKVTNLSALESLKALKELYIDSTEVSSLAPLKMLQLAVLTCDHTQVSDLTPLEDMRSLKTVSCVHTAVSDLKPLKNSSLEKLNISQTNVSDLTPLQSMDKLTEFNCADTKVSDLKPLEKSALKVLDISSTDVSDLKPLQSLKIVNFNCANSQVSDLKPLERMPLQTVDIWNTKVTDLSPLQDTPLQTLRCYVKFPRDAAALRKLFKNNQFNIVSLINDPYDRFRSALTAAPIKSVAEKWVTDRKGMTATEQKGEVVDELKKRNIGTDVKVTIEDGKVTELEITDVRDLSPVQVCGDLKRLVHRSKSYAIAYLCDLSPLKGLKLTHLDVAKSNVMDLSPLEGMPLEYLDCSQTLVTDLSPLRKMPLRVLRFEGTAVTDLSPLRDIPTLETINGKPKKDVLK